MPPGPAAMADAPTGASHSGGRVPHTTPGTRENAASINAPSGAESGSGQPRSAASARSGCADEGRPQVLVDRLLRDPEGTTDPDGF